jgi:hypothetical protein
MNARCASNARATNFSVTTSSRRAEQASCISIDEFADQIEAVFEDYFEVTASQPDAYESLMM